jgi:hypothetical protein
MLAQTEGELQVNCLTIRHQLCPKVSSLPIVGWGSWYKTLLTDTRSLQASFQERPGLTVELALSVY